MNISIRKYLFGILTVVVILITGFLIYNKLQNNNSITDSSTVFHKLEDNFNNVLPVSLDKESLENKDTTDEIQADVVKVASQINETAESKKIVKKIADSISLKLDAMVDKYIKKADIQFNVPFTTQAPFANWDPPYNEACEEASMIMVDYYKKGLTLNPSIADQQIIKFINWETQKGYDIDLTAYQIKTVLKQYMNIDSSLKYEPTKDDLLNNLLEGKLLIVPVAGRLLGNSYFTPPGPLYHVLVVTGYDQSTDEFITNDPGTRRGKNYRYATKVLIDAIHDWNGGGVIDGQKVVIVIE